MLAFAVNLTGIPPVSSARAAGAGTPALPFGYYATALDAGSGHICLLTTSGAVYQLQVVFYNGTTTLATKTTNFAIGTHGFQKVNSTFIAPSAYTKITFTIVFKAASGYAWFDTAALNYAP